MRIDWYEKEYKSPIGYEFRVELNGRLRKTGKKPCVNCDERW